MGGTLAQKAAGRARIFVALAGAAMLSHGCLVDNSDLDPAFANDSAEPAPAPTGPLPKGGAKLESRGFFATAMVPLLTRDRPLGACASCHQGGGQGLPFLGPEDLNMYNSVTASAVVAESAAASSLANIGPHTGDGLCVGESNPSDDCEEDERIVVTRWLTLELGQ